jgi:hypothetical protein
LARGYRKVRSPPFARTPMPRKAQRQQIVGDRGGS